LVLWDQADQSFVNAHDPAITISIAPNEEVWVSFNDGVSGAWSAVYDDTRQGPYGQVFNTWGEFTTRGRDSTFDVSRLVNMGGHAMQIEGPGCVSNMNTCVFVCPNSNSCMNGVELRNCANGSQQNAAYGTFGGAPSGGCHIGGPTEVRVTFS
jgi:hypothetical protein